MFFEIGVPKNFVEFTGKHSYRSLFFNRDAGFQPVNFYKKRIWYWGFPLNFATFLEK